MVEETQIVECCIKLLTFAQGGDAELYCIKLEAYWILTNLFMTNDEEILYLILGISDG